MFLKSKGFQLCLAFAIGAIVLLLPRPEGTKFKITGDIDQKFLQQISQNFTLIPDEQGKDKGYIVEAKNPGTKESTAAFLEERPEVLTCRELRLTISTASRPRP